jgi:PAS domain-containing protein
MSSLRSFQVKVVMPQREIEIILARQLASYLATPIFIVDPQGTLAFYNEPAEAILGRRFDETGEMRAEEWSTLFRPVDENGEPLQPDALPLVIALKEQHPSHRSFSISGLDGVLRHIQVTAFPLIGQADRFLGAIAIFWEVKRP